MKQEHGDTAINRAGDGGRSAGFQPAVSPNSIRQALPMKQRLRIGNSRYSRLEVCATLAGLRRASTNLLVLVSFGLLVIGIPSLLEPASAQPSWSFGGQISVDAQRNAVNAVRNQASWLNNAMRTAPNFRTGALDQVWQQFQLFRGSYNTLKTTLTAQQLQYGANDLAELDGGLDILAESFSNYQEDVGGGQSDSRALRNLCRVLGQQTVVWMQEFNRVCTRLRIGSL
jgi:hypothetical protein